MRRDGGGGSVQEIVHCNGFLMTDGLRFNHQSCKDGGRPVMNFLCRLHIAVICNDRHQHESFVSWTLDTCTCDVTLPSMESSGQ